MTTCRFCRQRIATKAISYYHWFLHEGCWLKLQRVALRTGGQL